MECGCKQPSKAFYLEGEYGADPVWCQHCDYNIELDELAIPEALMDELLHWANAYGQWVDLQEENFIAGGEAMQEAHNEEGQLLAKKLQLATGYTVAFHPSMM